MDLVTSSGHAEVPIVVSRDWTRRQDEITRAVIYIHGWPRRDLGALEHAAKAAGSAADTTIEITPQFVTAKDVTAHQLPDDILKWRENDWQKGEPSEDAAAISSFQVIDEAIRRLADRSIFPNLNIIVLAGHSAGGQFVQRYAAIGKAEADLGNAPIHIRYVVSNPSTYLYFTNDRPASGGGFAPIIAATSCPSFDHWPYGLQGVTAPYENPLISVGKLAMGYLHRDVIYLLGTADDDPQADGLDRSCGAEMQGRSRYVRGIAYNAYIHMLDPTTPQHVLEARGIRHLSYPMLSSACGLSALFDRTGCDLGSR